MAKHTYSKCLIHLIWSTKNREPVLEADTRKKLSEYLYQYSKDNNIYMYINYVNADHVHAFFDLPTSMSLQDVSKLYKGSSSHWINKNRLTPLKFCWARGYGGFSVSPSNFTKVKSYILNQEKHHSKKSFAQELNDFLKAYRLEV